MGRDFHSSELLSVKELGEALRRNDRYVYAMKQRGFLMPSGLATLTEARAWLIRNPPPRSRKYDRVRLRQ
jgi:hypothetical protein